MHLAISHYRKTFHLSQTRSKKQLLPQFGQFPGAAQEGGPVYIYTGLKLNNIEVPL